MLNLSKRLAALEVRHRFLTQPDATPPRAPISVETAEQIFDILWEAGGEDLIDDVFAAQTERLEREG